MYISAASCGSVTRSSNSVARAGEGGMRRPQLGFPRLRVRATGIAIGPDHTPPNWAPGTLYVDGHANINRLHEREFSAKRIA